MTEQVPLLPYVFPGDYEAHSAVWLSWQSFDHQKGKPIRIPLFQIISGLKQGSTAVSLLVQDAAEEAQVKQQAIQASPPCPLDHVTFYTIPHSGHWARDMGPQFVRSLDGKSLAIVDWNFNSWGHEDPSVPDCRLNDEVHRRVAEIMKVSLIPVSKGEGGVRMVHEGGSVAHNGYGTMIGVESVAMQRNMGPNSFFGGQSPISDLSYPTTYKPSTAWDACRLRLEQEYRRSLGVKKLIWVSTGDAADDGTFRGPVGKQFHVTEFDGKPITHSGAYTLYTTNGHADEFVRFVSEDTVFVAESTPAPLPPHPTPLDQLTNYLETSNHERMERAADILKASTTAEGKPLKVLRMPMPDLLYTVMQPGDPLYDYYAAYDRWENPKDRLKGNENMFCVLPVSYVNYFPSGGIVCVARYWREGRAESIKRKDAECVRLISEAFPGKKIVPIDIENINMGGGGIHCSVQQQPAFKK